jgi:hypothetical protein
MFCMGAIFYQPSQKENDKMMGLASHAVPRMVMITIDTLLAGEFNICLLVLISLYPPGSLTGTFSCATTGG